MRYDYKCEACGHVEEHEFPIAKAPEFVICQSCSVLKDGEWESHLAHRRFALFGFSIKHQYHIINQRPGKGATKSDSSHNLRGRRGGYEMEPKGKKK